LTTHLSTLHPEQSVTIAAAAQIFCPNICTTSLLASRFWRSRAVGPPSPKEGHPMTIHISGWFTSLTDLEICALALCATITVCTIGAVFVVVSVMVGAIENSTKRLVRAAWHGPNNAGMNLAQRFEKHLVGIQLEAQR
jgi:hypothetical protein